MISAGTNRFTGILGNTEMSCAPISIFGRLNKYFRCILVIDSFNEPRSVGFNWKIPSDFFFLMEKMWFKVNEFEWLIIGVNHGYEEFIYLWVGSFYRIISIIPVAVRIWFFQPKKKKIWKKKWSAPFSKMGGSCGQPMARMQISTPHGDTKGEGCGFWWPVDCVRNRITGPDAAKFRRQRALVGGSGGCCSSLWYSEPAPKKRGQRRYRFNAFLIPFNCHRPFIWIRLAVFLFIHSFRSYSACRWFVRCASCHRPYSPEFFHFSRFTRFFFFNFHLMTFRAAIFGDFFRNSIFK